MYVMRLAVLVRICISHIKKTCCIVYVFGLAKTLKVRSEKLFFCKLLVDIKLLCSVSHMIPSLVIYTQKS